MQSKTHSYISFNVLTCFINCPWENINDEIFAENKIFYLIYPVQVRTSSLDRDILDFDEYVVDVIAIDSGNPRLNDSVQVKVTIDDINDKAPAFNNTSFKTLEINEDFGIGDENQIGNSELISSGDPELNTKKLFLIKYN